MATRMILTERIYDNIDAVLSRNDIPDEVKDELREYAKSRTVDNQEDQPNIPFSTLGTLHKCLGTDEKPGISLHELLEGSEVVIPNLQKPKRNPELVARLNKLRIEQENREYRQMTRNVETKIVGGSPLAQIGKEMRSVQAELMSVFNVVLTVVAAFFFGFMAMYYSGQSVTARVLCGLAFAIIVASADLYFFIKNDV